MEHVSLSSAHWSGTHYVPQPDLKLKTLLLKLKTILQKVANTREDTLPIKVIYARKQTLFIMFAL